MGLILRDKGPNDKQDKINSNYQGRYVELAKPLSGALAVVIHSMLDGTVSDSAAKLSISNNIATFICWILGEQLIHRICIYLKLYSDPHAKNPLYRNLKTLASLGTPLGIIAASMLKQRPSFTLTSMVMGTVVALFAFVLPQLYNEQNEINLEAQVGTEGWSKYAKTALIFGSYIGQGLGGTIAYLQTQDSPASVGNITIYSAAASVLSFVAVMLFVPIINYLTKSKDKPNGILVTEDRDVFNNNYVRSGITLGGALGTILGGLLGPLLIQGLGMQLAVAIGASTLAVIAGIGLGIYGQKLSIYFENNWGISHDTDNSWSYATRSMSYLFSCSSIILVYALCPAASLASSLVIGSAIASALGWFTGLLVIWLARKIEPDESKTSSTSLPWTQRLSIGITRGTIIGSIVGLALGCSLAGPLGLVGWSILAGAIGGIIGGVIDLISDPCFGKIIDKAGSSLSNTDNHSPRKKSDTANPSNNHYSFFSDKSIKQIPYTRKSAHEEQDNSDIVPSPDVLTCRVA